MDIDLKDLDSVAEAVLSFFESNGVQMPFCGRVLNYLDSETGLVDTVSLLEADIYASNENLNIVRSALIKALKLLGFELV